jgi:hypothetical protein
LEAMTLVSRDLVVTGVEFLEINVLEIEGM